MATVTISDQVYQTLMEAAAARGVSPDTIIAEGIAALDEQPAEEPMTADEFAVALGMTPEDVAHADEEARRRYPEAFGIPRN